MVFTDSAHLDWLRQEAPHDRVVSSVRALLALVGKDKQSIVDALTAEPIKNEVLGELDKWNARLKPHSKRARIAHEAVRFWVAQTLSVTQMRGHALDATYDYGAEVNGIMEIGAGGIFEFGKSQFLVIRDLAEKIVAFIKQKDIRRAVLVESPLGNSLVVQIIRDFAHQAGVEIDTHVWNSPRNDRKKRGTTISEAAELCVEAVRDYDLIIFVDDVSTGTRLLKIFDALSKRLDAKKFLTIGLVVTDTWTPRNDTHPNRARLCERLSKQAIELGFEDVWIFMPILRLFNMDDGAPCRWQTPLVWENSDLIAGQRKVNLLFTILDHLFDMLDDLGRDESQYRHVLEAIWSRDTSGQRFISAPGIVKTTFADIALDVDLGAIKDTIEEGARTRFPEDYQGQYDDKGDTFAFVKERWDWIRAQYFELLGANITPERVALSWRALDNVFAATLNERLPQPSRDQASTPYVIPFNRSIRALNLQLRKLVITYQHPFANA